jgi:DNA topoisomerase-1
MESAEFERTTVDIAATAGGKTAGLRATGSVQRFDGFLKLYQESRDDDAEDEDGRLPRIAVGDALARRSIAATQHFTEPPPRYTEATLVKKMEELGIGRPSTYAATLATLRDREYVEVDKKRLIPSDKGRIVTAFLGSFFDRYVEYDFTASLEEDLDRISNGDLEWREVLRKFWEEFNKRIAEVKELRVSEVLDALNDELAAHVFPARADGSDPRSCPNCGTGRLSLKLGKFGSFIGCSNYPECRYTRQLGNGSGEDQAEGLGGDGTKVLGTDPKTGLEVSLRVGRFGPYVQLGEGDKPKRSSLPKGWTVESMDLDRALMLLDLPRAVGTHPESGKPIEANIGRYGPYVAHDGVYANLDSVDEVFVVGLNRAVAVLAEKKEKGGRARATPAALKSLGDHPDGGGEITVRDGRYGPYVAWGKVYATLPKGMDPQAVTLEQALPLLAEKAGKSGGGKAKTAKAAPKEPRAAKAADKPAKAKSAAPKTRKAS